MRLTVTIQSLVGGRGAQRIIAPHLLAVDRRAQRQMLAGLEREAVAQFGRNFEADRIGFGRSPARSPRPSAHGNARPCARLPGRVGIGARQELHHREQMAEMLAVVAAPAAEDRALVGGRFELRFGKHRGDRRAIFVLELARVGRNAARRSPPAASRRPRTARGRSASTSRALRPCAARFPRCRRRAGSSIRTRARGDRRLP